jgi:hypothetical protein
MKDSFAEWLGHTSQGRLAFKPPRVFCGVMTCVLCMREPGGLSQAAKDAIGAFQRLGRSLLGTPLTASDVFTGLLVPRICAPFSSRDCCAALLHLPGVEPA